MISACLLAGNELLLKLPGNIQTTLRVPDGLFNPLMSEMQTVGTLARCLSWPNLCQLLASIMAERRVVVRYVEGEGADC